MSQNFCHTLYYIPHLASNGEGRGYIVSPSFDVCQSNKQKSVEQMSQNFHHTLYISDKNVSPMEICGMNVADFHHILYISDYNVTPMEICGTNVTEFSSYIVYK
jgi:hypothetical protein